MRVHHHDQLPNKDDYKSSKATIVTTDCDRFIRYKQHKHAAFVGYVSDPETFPYDRDPEAQELKHGLHCKACGATLNETNDPELCFRCLEVAQQLAGFRFAHELPDELVAEQEYIDGLLTGKIQAG